MIFYISKIIQLKVLDRIRNGRYFGIMIDESTDIVITSHLVMLATFVEDGLQVSFFFRSSIHC